MKYHHQFENISNNEKKLSGQIQHIFFNILKRYFTIYQKNIKMYHKYKV